MNQSIEAARRAFLRLSIAFEFAFARRWKKQHPKACGEAQSNEDSTVGEMVQAPRPTSSRDAAV
jgi:hypothetical protein